VLSAPAQACRYGREVPDGLEPGHRAVAVSISPASVGARLRDLRRRRGLSLQEVQALSGQAFKAGVLSAYERGERAISVPRLLRLAELYGVPIAYFFHLDPNACEIDLTERVSDEEGVTVDVARLGSVQDYEVALVLARHVASVQLQRHDFQKSLVTIRGHDLDVLAIAMEQSPEEFRNRLDALHLIARPHNDSLSERNGRRSS
jgi:transcriptional regulator with XRE-family HTH domain